MGRKQSNKPVEPGGPAETGEAIEGKAKRYSVTIEPDLARKIRVLAAAEDVSPPDWVNNQLRRLIRDQWPKLLEDLMPE